MADSRVQVPLARVRCLRSLAGAMLFALVALLPSLIQAAPSEVEGLRTSSDNGQSRLVFQLSAPVSHQIFTLSDPSRVVIDVRDAELDGSLPKHLPQSDLVKRVRTAPRDHGNDLRIVLDLEKPARPKSFVLQPAADYGNRLVVDVVAGDQTQTADKPAQQEHVDKPHDLVVAIDPGHGGHDPGAEGFGLKEKSVVLDVAQRLNTLLKKTSGIRPIMTRDSDVYLPLRERIERARKADADLFISVHANSFANQQPSGSAVYALSTDGATSEAARRMARRENSADRIGGVSLHGKNKAVASVLLDLSQTATIDSSLSVGDRVLKQLGQVNRLHKHSVQQAAFVVLKSPDIPSILVETDFISNPRDARNLNSSSHQEKLARAIRDGVRNFFEKKAPRGTQYARN